MPTLNMIEPLLPDLGAAKEKIKGLEAEVKALKHAERINQVLLEISNAVTTTRHLNDLYISIHNSLNHLIHAPNFYICIYDRENQLLRFPYAVDERDERIGEAIVLFEENSLTGEVILTGKPLFLDQAMLEQRQKENRLQGSLPKTWLGVPLKARDEVFGAIAIQSYTHAEAFTMKDLDLLILVSNQIALAIDRKQLQETIRKSEERHRTLAEKSHDIIIRFDQEFRIQYVNPAVKALGLVPSEMMGEFLDDLDFPESQIQFWKESIVKVFHTQAVNRIEFQIPRGNWLDCLLCPEFDADRDVVSVITFARDITQRKETELHNENLDIINHIIIQNMDMESMLNQILDAMIQMFDCDRAWILFPCDPDARYFELPFMRTRPQWYQKPGFQVEITPKAKIDLQEVLRAKEPVVYDPESGKHIRSSIKDFYHIQSMMVMPVFPKLGAPWEVGLHQCSHNRIWKIGEQQLFKTICQRIGDGLSNLLLHRQLGQAKSYIDNIFDSMPSILMGVDPQGKITHWNQEAGLSTGIGAQDAVGSFFYDILPGTYPLLKSIQTAVNLKKVVEKTKQKQRIGSRIIFQNITVYPLASQEVKGAVIRMDDVTEQMRLEQMMVQSEKMLSIGGLAAGMAHEINNPLAGMMQNAQVIEARLTRSIPANCSAADRAGIDLGKLQSYLEYREILGKFNHINEAGKHAAKIVSNMLSFAKKGQDRKAYENLTDLLERTMILAKNEYSRKRKFDLKKIQVQVNAVNEFPSVFCEGSKIQQVFLNIIKNGTEAMFDQCTAQAHPPGQPPGEPEFKIDFLLENELAVIRISDNGPGMTPDLQKQVFDPFFTTKGPGKGTGLGLSISYFIVTEDHKGKMDLTSVPGKGSCFTIRLPIHG